MNLVNLFSKKQKKEEPSVFDNASLINYPRLMSTLAEMSESFQQAEPFPHIVIDDFLDENVLRAVLANYPKPDDLTWMTKGSKTENGKNAQVNKHQFVLGRHNLANEMQLNSVIRYLMLELNSGTCVRFLSLLSGIPNLIADSRMWGGGLHQTIQQGMLRVHADFLKHPEFNIDRRLNLLLFLNPEWQEQWGGSLELWSKDMQSCEQSILPIANRCVIFATSSDSYHGFTKPIACPPDTTRKSIAMYYYTVPGSDNPEKPITFWQDLPEE